jgi:sorbitol-specific phosphotransferase system component IIBC
VDAGQKRFEVKEKRKEEAKKKKPKKKKKRLKKRRKGVGKVSNFAILFNSSKIDCNVKKITYK